MRAPFIVFEGLDGSGTTTQARRLVDALGSAGHRVHFTREPSDGPIGTNIRQALGGRLTRPGGERLTPETLALLFAADRMDHLATEILPLCEKGIIVVCDRYVLSSVAYQGQELDPAFVRAINARAASADLTLFLEVSPETALHRRADRHLGDELYEALAVQQRVSRAYEDAVSLYSESQRIRIVDGERGIDQVAWDCLEVVRGLLER